MSALDEHSRVPRVRRIGLLGAESSGKSTLAIALAGALNDQGMNAIVVPEYLREWCERHGRTPELGDQVEILRGQIAAEDHAAEVNPGAILVCDPAAITTPMYSRLYFADPSEFDLAQLLRYEILLWCDIDFDWVTDPLRDGHRMREHMHHLIANSRADFEQAHGYPIPLISGPLPDRIALATAMVLGRRGNTVSL